jgi:hypothetical protein
LIPEQVVSLYSSYTRNKIGASLPPDPLTIVSLVRAYIALDNIASALTLLDLASKWKIDFDLDSKSTLMYELARHSQNGLVAALKIRESMLLRNEKINSHGIVGLLEGLRIHSLSPTSMKIKRKKQS